MRGNREEPEHIERGFLESSEEKTGWVIDELNNLKDGKKKKLNIKHGWRCLQKMQLNNINKY